MKIKSELIFIQLSRLILLFNRKRVHLDRIIGSMKFLVSIAFSTRQCDSDSLQLPNENFRL